MEMRRRLCDPEETALVTSLPRRSSLTKFYTIPTFENDAWNLEGKLRMQRNKGISG
jgi:hypothetical protein